MLYALSLFLPRYTVCSRITYIKLLDTADINLPQFNATWISRQLGQAQYLIWLFVLTREKCLSAGLSLVWELLYRWRGGYALEERSNRPPSIWLVLIITHRRYLRKESLVSGAEIELRVFIVYRWMQWTVLPGDEATTVVKYEEDTFTTGCTGWLAKRQIDSGGHYFYKRRAHRWRCLLTYLVLARFSRWEYNSMINYWVYC